MIPEFLKVRGESRGLVIAGWHNVGLLVFGLIGLMFDRRTILGLNPWIKPLKFDLSVIVFVLTMAWMLSLLKRFRRTRIWVAWGIGVSMIIENSVISMQSFRGVRSHMNVSSLFDGMAFATMGIFIALSTLLVALVLLLYCLPKTGLPPALAWGIRLGLLTLLAGSVEGVLMISVVGAHTVGAPDGGAGLPFVNWSQKHGDLRVAHFFALHALQALPFAGWAISRAGWRSGRQIASIFGVFAGYAGGVWVLFAQAMAGRPVL